MQNLETETTSTTTNDRRRHERVAGPFDGRRIGALETPVRIYDLSEGGCFINSLHEQHVGVAFHLEIELPYEGSIRVKAKTLYRKAGFGFAVRFIEMSEDATTRLERALQYLREREPYDV